MGEIQLSVQELSAMPEDSYQLVDIRDERARSYGVIPGSVALSAEELSESQEIDKNKTVVIYCQKGEMSVPAAEALQEAGVDARSLNGGYLAWLMESMKQKEEAQKEEETPEYVEIEQSIRKKFRKTIWCRFTRAVREYELVKERDKIAVCISGGKDSMLMAKLFQELKRHNKFNFEVVFLVMDPGYSPANRKVIEENARKLNIPITIFESDIFDSVYNIEKSPCYLCARMRRGHLYHFAQELGCNKIALGHHYDDVIETILMGMLYSGKVETMMPKLHSQNFEGMELIRPMYLIKESAIKAWRDTNGLHFIQCACRFTENCVSCGGGRGSKRDEMKELVAQFRNTSSVIETNIFNSVRDINLRTVMGYHKDGEYYNFLDDYDQRGNKGADKEKE